MIFAYRSIAVESVHFIVQQLFCIVSQLLLGVGWLTDWLIEEERKLVLHLSFMHPLHSTKKEGLLQQNEEKLSNFLSFLCKYSFMERKKNLTGV